MAADLPGLEGAVVDQGLDVGGRDLEVVGGLFERHERGQTFFRRYGPQSASKPFRF